MLFVSLCCTVESLNEMFCRLDYYRKLLNDNVWWMLICRYIYIYN